MANLSTTGTRWHLCLALAGSLALAQAGCGDGLPDLQPAADQRADAPESGQAAPASTDVSVIVEPSDGGAALLAAINGAKKSIHMTMYLLTATPIRDALIARSKAGVDVRVVLNQNFPPGTSVNNQSAFAALKKAGVQVAWAASRYTYTHEKCLVIDGQVAWIMTMNASNSSLVNNREYLAVDKTAADVAEAEAQFAADFAGRAYTPAGGLLMSPVTSRPGLLALIGGARATLNFEVEEISDPQIATALCDAQHRGAAVRGVISAGTPSSTEKAALAQLKGCGVRVVSLATPYIHAKAIVADGAQVYVGSENFSAVSLDQNRELGLITASAAAVGPVARAVSADLAAGAAL